MNILENIIPANLSGAIFWTLFHSLWISFIVCVVLYLILKSSGNRNSSYRYNLAALGYVLIVFSTLGMFLLEYNGLGIMTEVPQSNLNNITAILGGAADTPGTMNNSFIQFITNQSSFFVQLYLIVLILLCIKYLMGFNSNKMLRTHSHPLGLEYLKTAKELAIKLGIRNTFKFRASEIAKSAVTIGWLKPLVLIPVGIVSSMPYSEIESIIAHELAHLKRNDYFFKLIQAMFDIVFYFNPFTHWLSNIIKLEREKTCGEIAANLTEANTPADASRKSAAQPALSFSLMNDGKKLLKSVKHLIDKSDESENPQRNGAIILLTTILFSMVILTFTSSSTPPLSLSGLQNGASGIDMLQLDSNIDQITKMLNNIKNPQVNSGIAAKTPDKNSAAPVNPEISNNNISERYTESLQSMGLNLDDLNGQVDVYNKFLENNLLGPGMSMPGMEKLNTLEGFDGEFDMQKFQQDMTKMNAQLKNLREIIRGQPQTPIKK